MDYREQMRNIEARYMLKRDLEKTLINIDELEKKIPSTVSPTELVKLYLELGNVYANLLSLLGAPSQEDEKNRDTVQNASVNRQSALEIANTYYQSALDIVKQDTYPSPSDRETVEKIVNASRRQEAQAKTEIAKQRSVTTSIYKKSKPVYNGYWVQPIALRLPLIGLIIIILGIIFLYGRIPISVAFHIPPYNCVQGSITVNGSTAMLPLMNIAKQEYQKLCTGSTINVNPGKLSDGTNALNQVLNRSIDIATSDVFADTSVTQLQDHQVAVVVYALVVNSDVTAVEKPDLSSYQIASIYSGAVNTWSNVNKTWNPKTPITLVSRPPSSETRTIFEKYILAGTETASGPPQLTDDTTATVTDNICKTSGAIGYVSLYYYYTHIHCLHLVSIDHNNPQSAEFVKNNTYKFWSLEHMYTRGSATGLAQAFIDFMYSGLMKSYINQYDQYGYLSPTDITSEDALASH